MSAPALRTIALLLTLLALDGAWLAVGAAALAPAGAGLPWALLVALGAPFLLGTRWLWSLDAWLRPQGRLAVAAGALLLVSLLMGAAAPGEVGMLAGPGAWLRAVVELPRLPLADAPLSLGLVVGSTLVYRSLQAIVQHPLTTRVVARMVGQGGGLLVLGVLVLHTRRLSIPVGLLFLFFACALLAIALARATEISRVPGVSRLPFTPRWLGTVLGAVVGVLMLAALVRLLPWRSLSVLGPLLAPLYNALVWLVASIGQALVFLLFPLFQRLLGQSGFAPRRPLPLEEGMVEPALSPDAPPTLYLESLAPYFLLFFLLLMLIVFFGRLAQRRQAGEGAEPLAEYDKAPREPSEPWTRPRNPFSALFARRPHFGTESVRDLYKNLLLFGDAHGLPRPAEDTPYDYLIPLCEQYPHHRADFRALTDAYVATRYGEEALPRAELERLQAAWQRVVAEGEERQRIGDGG